MIQDIDQNIFEERAERLSQDELKKWTEITQLDRSTLEKLKGPGVKLLLGPRGSGKSTLLKLAYFEAMESEQILPIYVNYSHSLALEPLFHSNANALIIFRQWVLLKILESLLESIKYIGIEPNNKLLISAKKINENNS
jgi:predicted AAA+ superfamily ATPase